MLSTANVTEETYLVSSDGVLHRHTTNGLGGGAEGLTVLPSIGCEHATSNMPSILP